MNLIITYDLKRPFQNYPDLIKALQDIRAIHAMQSVWFVKGDSSQAIFDYLMPFIDDNDILFVAHVPYWNSKRLPQAAVNLLKS